MLISWHLDRTGNNCIRSFRSWLNTCLKASVVLYFAAVGHASLSRAVWILPLIAHALGDPTSLTLTNHSTFPQWYAFWHAKIWPHSR